MSKIATYTKAIKDLDLGIDGLRTYHIAKRLVNANRRRMTTAKAEAVREALIGTPLYSSTDWVTCKTSVRYGSQTILVV